MTERMFTQAYGASPDPGDLTRWDPSLIPWYTSTGTGVPAPTRRVVTAARVDKDGKLWLRISIDGVHVREVSTDGTTLTIEEDL